MFCTEELIFKLEEDISLSHGEKKVRKFERAPRPNRLSTHVSLCLFISIVYEGYILSFFFNT